MRCPCFQTREDLTAFLELEGLSPERARTVASRIFPGFLFLENLPGDLLASLLESLERSGGEGVILPGPKGREDGTASILLAGTQEQLETLAKAGDRTEAVGGALTAASDFSSILKNLSGIDPASILFRGKKMDFSGSPLLMGVLNITPDSFSDGGRFLDFESAVRKAFQMIEEGADILDLGGASSRPGSDRVPEETQKERVLPVIREIRKRWDGWISVDTYSASVARAAIDAGADIINDISAGRMDAAMTEVAAEMDVPVVLMHMKGTPKTMQIDPGYESLFSELAAYFEERIRMWTEAGVSRERMLIDPGIGFGKNVLHNLVILKHLGELRIFGLPVVLGTSRKSFIGTVLNKAVGERLIGALATVAIGAWNGAQVLRVHDVAETREVLDIVNAIRRSDCRAESAGRVEADEVCKGKKTDCCEGSVRNR